MPNGLETEHALWDELATRGFSVTKNPILDKTLKVDGVVTRPPTSDPVCFFPSPIAVQITTRVRDWQKRAEFVRVAKDVARCLAYIELSGPMSGEIANATASALTYLFYCVQAPQIALVTVASNRFDLFNMNELLRRYQAWLNACIPGRLSGEITHWREKGYGFLTAKVAGPDRSIEVVQFFVHINSVEDESLKRQLTTTVGDVRIPVTFEDGGAPPNEDRKSAISLQPA